MAPHGSMSGCGCQKAGEGAVGPGAPWKSALSIVRQPLFRWFPSTHSYLGRPEERGFSSAVSQQPVERNWSFITTFCSLPNDLFQQRKRAHPYAVVGLLQRLPLLRVPLGEEP